MFKVSGKKINESNFVNTNTKYIGLYLMEIGVSHF
jgi:hypothetical protein